MRAMRIIDAHLHFAREPYFDGIARQAGHVNSAEHLEAEYARLRIACGIVMGLPIGALMQRNNGKKTT